MKWLIIREYISYIKTNPKLLWNVPLRLWEESYLYTRYVVAKLSHSPQNPKLLKDLHKLTKEMDNNSSLYKPSLLWKDLYDQFERVLYVEDINAFKKDIIDGFPRSHLVILLFIKCFYGCTGRILKLATHFIYLKK